MMHRTYTYTGAPAHDYAPPLPGPVAVTALNKGIPLSDLAADQLCGYWYPMNGWHGMFLGIERDGHAHT